MNSASPAPFAARRWSPPSRNPRRSAAPDLIDRDFVAPAPNRYWVADFTHVAAWAGVVYVAFVVDTFSRRIVGWSAATTKHTELVLAAVEMGLWQRDREANYHQTDKKPQVTIKI